MQQGVRGDPGTPSGSEKDDGGKGGGRVPSQDGSQAFLRKIDADIWGLMQAQKPVHDHRQMHMNTVHL